MNFTQQLTPDNVLNQLDRNVSPHETEGMSVGQSPSVASTIDCLGSNYLSLLYTKT
jgi:hypothetical protein